MITLDTAITSTLTGDAQFTSLAVEGLHRGKAPKGTPFPYGVFFYIPMSGGAALYTFTREACERFIIGFKGVAVSTAEKGGDQIAGEIAERMAALILDQLTTGEGKRVLMCRRRGQIDHQEDHEGTEVFHIGFTADVWVASE